MANNDEKIPCRAGQALTRWLTQGPQCWSHIPGTGELFTQMELTQRKTSKKGRKKCCVWKKKVYGPLGGWVDWLVVTNSYQSAQHSAIQMTKTTVDDKSSKVTRDLLWSGGKNYPKKVNFQFPPAHNSSQNWPQSHSDSRK